MRNSSIVVLIISSISVLSCGNRVNAPNLEFTPEQTTYIKFVVTNCNTEKALSAYYMQMLPARMQKQNIEFNSDTSFIKAISLNHPLYIYLIDKKHAMLFVVPNDTLLVNLDYSGNKPLLEAISFSGVTGAISDYLTYKRYYHRYPPRDSQSVANFNSMIDSLYGQELDKLDSLGKSGTLPVWFTKLEESNIKYEREYLKLNQYSKRFVFYRQFYHRDPIIPENIDFGSIEYYWLENATKVLAAIHEDKYDSLLTQQLATDEIFLESQQANIDLLKRHLSEDVLSFYVASRLSVNFMQKKLLRMTPVELERRKQEIEDFLQINKGLISDTLIYNYLIQEQRKAYQPVEDSEILQPGKEAPNFYLSDINGNYKQLSDYEGKVILLSFWGTYCSPCIKDIPKKNSLVEQFSNDDFVLINICTDANSEEWKEIINTNDFQGVHLICKGNWEQKLRTEYNIYDVPHYTIIGKDGRVIRNNYTETLEKIIRESI